MELIKIYLNCKIIFSIPLVKNKETNFRKNTIEQDKNPNALKKANRSRFLIFKIVRIVRLGPKINIVLINLCPRKITTSLSVNIKTRVPNGASVL